MDDAITTWMMQLFFFFVCVTVVRLDGIDEYKEEEEEEEGGARAGRGTMCDLKGGVLMCLMLQAPSAVGTTDTVEDTVQIEPAKDEKTYEVLMDFDLPKKKKKRRTVSGKGRRGGRGCKCGG